MHIHDIGCEGLNWFHLAQERVKRSVLENTIMILWAPCGSGNFLTIDVTVRFSRTNLLH